MHQNDMEAAEEAEDDWQSSVRHAWLKRSPLKAGDSSLTRTRASRSTRPQSGSPLFIFSFLSTSCCSEDPADDPLPTSCAV